jgi:hypothetical protein
VILVVGGLGGAYRPDCDARAAVLEVDGRNQHANPDGRRPGPARYADGVRGDRNLKLAGYEVFRFGATELQDRQQARNLLQAFFADLSRRFGPAPADPARYP